MMANVDGMEIGFRGRSIRLANRSFFADFSAFIETSQLYCIRCFRTSPD